MRTIYPSDHSATPQTQRLFSALALAAFACCFAFVTTAQAGISPAVKCEATKNKVLGKFAFCILKANAKAVKKGEEPDAKVCITKAEEALAKADDKHGPDCPAFGDPSALLGTIESCTNSAAADLQCEGGDVGGAVVAGSCYVLSDGSNCDDACTSVDRSYSDATETYAAATKENCNEVLDALGDTAEPLDVDPPLCVVPVGCNTSGDARSACSNATSDATNGLMRACACE